MNLAEAEAVVAEKEAEVARYTDLCASIASSADEARAQLASLDRLNDTEFGTDELLQSENLKRHLNRLRGEAAEASAGWAQVTADLREATDVRREAFRADLRARVLLDRNALVDELMQAETLLYERLQGHLALVRHAEALNCAPGSFIVQADRQHVLESLGRMLHEYRQGAHYARLLAPGRPDPLRSIERP